MSLRFWAICAASIAAAYAPASTAKPPLHRRPVPEAYTNWSLRQQQDKFTDEITQLAVLDNGPDRLAVICWPAKPGNGVTVLFIPHEPVSQFKRLSSYEVYPADVRLDSLPMAEGVLSKNGSGLQLQDYGKQDSDPATTKSYGRVMKFVSLLEASEILRIRVQSYDDQFLNWSFDLTGAKAAIQTLRGQCPASWSSK